MRPGPAWTVRVEAHQVGRWSVEEQTVTVRAINEVQARIAAAREVHRRLQIPSWKPLLRRTYLRTAATPAARAAA